MKKGKVYIAGAGCGDEKLITVKLKEILEKADCIIYDRLVNENILRFAKKNIEFIYMGKENTEGGELQEKINKTIILKATEGKNVLRLKGGDPFIFGRGGEEIEALLKENIKFEVIPGISSSIAVPTYAGIPVTHRGVNISFHVFTGHTKVDGKELDFKIMSKLEGTLIFLMGLGNIKEITNGLIENGKDKKTPVAVIKNGTTTKQKTYIGTLDTISNIVIENNIKSPAIIIVGDVVNLRENMKWFEEKKLFNKNVLITRNYEKQDNIISKINEYGGQALSLPCIEIEYLDYSLENLKDYSTILFNSANSVKGFMKKIDDIRILENKKIGVVGEKTFEEFQKYKIIPDFYPENYTVEELAKESVNFSNENDKILFVVSNISPVDCEKYSKKYNRNYEKLVVYETNKKIIEDNKFIKNFEKSDILMFLSSSTFESFIENLKRINRLNDNNELKKYFENKIITSIGPVTTKTIEKYGLIVDIEAKKYTENGLIEEIINTNFND